MKKYFYFWCMIIMVPALFISCSTNNDSSGVHPRASSDNTSYMTSEQVLEIAEKQSPDCRIFKASDNNTAP